MPAAPRLAYLYSRYPVVSQTFCDSEMLALEALGLPLTVASLNPPPSSFRHERLASLRAEVLYPPPSDMLKKLPVPPEMTALAAEHTQRYGESFKAPTRARNAAWFAREFARRGISHVHVHFANRATHTALFLKKAGYTFSFTAHAQDYMVDLGSHDLLREMAREAEFVIAVSDFSRDDLRRLCPESAGKIHRLYNGIRPSDFPAAAPAAPGPLRLVSVGRLIDFKGFHHLIDAVARAKGQGTPVELDIIGDGPLKEKLQGQISTLGLEKECRLLGVLSQEQIKTRLASAHAFALACCVDSKGASDILPTVIMEAMAARLPVLSTRLVGVPEMVEHGVTGLLTAPDSPEELAQAIRALASDPERRVQMGEAGHGRCRALFDLEKTGAELAARFAAVEAGNAQPAHPFPVLLLSQRADEPELPALAARGGIRVLAARASSADAWIDHLPDAIVLEAAWRANHSQAALCETFNAKLGPADGEAFFRDARRAVHTAELVRQRGIRHIHACRAADVTWAWLVKKLTGVRASFAVEDHPAVSRSHLAALVADFDFGTVGDAKLHEMTGKKHADVLALGPEPKKSLFSKPTAPVPDTEGWAARLLSA